MELAALVLVPALASGLTLSPLGRRWAAPITLVSSIVVLLFCLAVAKATLAAGHLEALQGGLACDGLGALVLILVALVATTAALFSWGYIRVRSAHADARKEQHYYGLYNLFVLSLVAVPILANVALMWVAVELTTLLSAFLVGFEATPEALEAAWKYVVLTTLGAVLALLGFLLLYWGTRLAGSRTFTWVSLVGIAPRMPPTLLWPAFLLILVGFGTKVGLVPMHTWLPDAHSQAPASICALLSGVETMTVLYVILRLFPVVSGVPTLDARPWFIGFGLLSVFVATLLLIYVRDFKRLFAFSTVEHMGIILVAAGLGGAEAHLAAAYQMMGHAIAKSFCFLAAGVVATTYGTQEIASVRGMARAAPGAAIALAAGALAIAGAPPFAIFIGELLIFKAGVASGQYAVTGVLAAMVAIAFCAVMAHINRMTFSPDRTSGEPLSAVPLSCRLALVLAGIALLLLGLYVPAGLGDLLRSAANAMGG
ncbi:MAG TPA: proton-conducting transporter membrane subunit [Steroidobacteraceae bacterium]|nr:proton-conducting transporter membrane subunit [Steroidobacteraceae bacterium]